MAADARFPVMGADAHVLVHLPDGTPAAADALLEHARRRLDELERRWSRFLPDSEVSIAERPRPVAGCRCPPTPCSWCAEPSKGAA